MAPSRLLGQVDGNFFVFDPRSVSEAQDWSYDIISYTWGPKAEKYDTGVQGVHWHVKLHEENLNQIKSFMVCREVQYLWVDALCINQDDANEVAAEMARMHEYYTGAHKCHILLLGMDEVWNPHDLVGDLRFIDHIQSYMHGAALASEARLTEALTQQLQWWTDTTWVFGMSKPAARAAGVELGVLNCYSTSVKRVQSLFNHLYFSRVWTFQEMLLGKNITLYAINASTKPTPIGELGTWMNLATEAKDKAVKLYAWIERSRVVKSTAVDDILGFIEDDIVTLDALQVQVRGVNAARTDIVSGGPHWWRDNHRGIANVFSAISIRPRECWERHDIFRGLLGVFNGLFTPDEMRRELEGTDIDALSFAFFKQLSIKTERAWTRLVTGSRERGEWDWIPVIANHERLLTTDCFSGVVDLGRLKPNGLAMVAASTGIVGSPRRYMTLTPHPKSDGGKGFRFIFKGCNCGKKVRSGLFSREPIHTYDQRVRVVKDQTGRTLVQCATILACIIDPGGDIVEYRRRLLRKLQPWWDISDRNAKPPGWIDRCVSGTPWENPDRLQMRVHNRSMDLDMEDILGCGSRLQNDTTANITCELRADCGCVVTAPFSLMLEAIAAVQGGVLGGDSATLDHDGRITLRDGLGLAQVGDVGKAFHLVAFHGDVGSYRSYASRCRSTRVDERVAETRPWPSGRALVREDFRHDFSDMMRDYGYIATGAGNLLICRNRPLGRYKVVGVCIDGPGAMASRNPPHLVTLK
ncbi:Heterokaryon incompatibility protein 6, OR allele [Madurella mycetomatis]|uniref:Heterokaryon incompatibility protein 6, OR allele n=1 Tax=Madurella mycetomatis TaxID=100816 RepID=A0A175VMW9_9PEZI|nr:Heterokaryon incompatibility protein 6, OR allele [Madurella mycetomatis]